MIFSNAFPEVPLLDINITNGEVPDTQIASVELTFSENKHDIATITYSGFPGIAVTSYRGLPVRILVGNNEANTIEFVGYVAYVEIEANTRMGIVNNSLIQMAKVVCFGSSYQMKSLRSTTYAKKTLKQLTEVIANKYGFSYSVPNNNYVFPLISQSGISDWELLIKTANKIGYSVVATGTHINVYDPYSAYYKQMPATVLRTITNLEGEDRRPGNIYEFKGFFGDVTPQSQSPETVIKSLDNLGKEFKYTSSQDSTSGLGTKPSARFTNEIIIDSTDKSSLEQYIKQYTRRSYGMTATASVIGVSSATPGRLAKIEAYDSQFDGYWLIEEATHLINTKHYITTLKLKTDSLSTSPLVLGKNATYKTPPSSKLANNIWKSSTEFAHVY